MNPLRRLLALLALVSALAIVPAGAQLNETPQSLNAQATDKMTAGDWEAALALLTNCVERFDKNAMVLFGPQFGVTWYRKGICELKLKRFEDAMTSFETCYTKYPNDAEKAQGGGNAFNKRSLLRAGEAAQGAEQYEKALEYYGKFLKERDASRDSFEPGSFYINLAICNFKLGKLDEGVKHFETALKNKLRYQTPDSGIVAAFQAFVGASIEKSDESALLGFVASNRAELVIEPVYMEPYVALFLSLAGQAYNAGMEKSAFALYQFLPATLVMLDDVNSRLARLGESPGIKDGSRIFRRSTLLDSRKTLEASLASGDPHEVIQLRATAFLHEKHGNIRGAYVSYKQLENLYPKSKRRETNLYNLVRTASLIGNTGETESYGRTFLDTYPDSENVPAVRRLMLTSLFFTGKYEEAIEIASEMLPKLEEGTPEHDICLHVLAGSYYYTGNFQQAQPLLDQHVEKYPESQFALSSAYFQASNQGRLQFWAKAAKMLDDFLAKYPDPAENVFLPFALYDRATAHFSLEENDAALEKLGRLESEFPNADIMAQALNLKGNVLQSQGNDAEAESYYVRALGTAETRGDAFVAAEALNYLIALLGTKPKAGAEGRLAEAVPYADKFWKDYSDSPYKARIAVSQIPALQQAGRGEEALNRLRDVISETAAIPGAPGLEEAIGSYTDAYLESHTPEELKNHYYNFPGIRTTDKAARALLRIAVIGVFEEQVKKAGEDQQKKIQAEAGIQVLFKDLKNEFELKDLSNFILVRVGDFIRATNSPREALAYYSEVLGREDKSYRFPALFGRAAVLAKGSREEQKEAIADFKRILADSQERSDKDQALFEMTATQLAAGDFKDAKDNARLYLDREKGYQKMKPEVSLMLGRAYEGLKMNEDALTAYLATLTSYKGAIRISAPAMASYMGLLWERNKQGDNLSDRQGAYNAGRDYIDQTRRIIDKATDEEREAWREVEKLVEQYAADPNVKTKEEMAAEAAR